MWHCSTLHQFSPIQCVTVPFVDTITLRSPYQAHLTRTKHTQCTLFKWSTTKHTDTHTHTHNCLLQHSYMPVSHIRMFVHCQKHTIAIHILYMDIPTGPLWYAHSYKTHIGMPLVIPYHNWLLIHTYIVCTYIHMYVAIGSKMSCTLHIWKIIPVQLNAQQPMYTLMALHGAHGHIQQ